MHLTKNGKLDIAGKKTKNKLKKLLKTQSVDANYVLSTVQTMLKLCALEWIEGNLKQWTIKREENEMKGHGKENRRAEKKEKQLKLQEKRMWGRTLIHCYKNWGFEIESRIEKKIRLELRLVHIFIILR